MHIRRKEGCQMGNLSPALRNLGKKKKEENKPKTSRGR